MTDDGVEAERRPVDRLTIFSDTVVAIAITLLAIDLPVPVGSTVSEFWTSVRHNSGHYAAFVISFVAIAASWNHHHDMFRYAEKMDPGAGTGYLIGSRERFHLADQRHGGRFRVVNTHFLRHYLRLGPLVRSTNGDRTGVPLPPPGPAQTKRRLASRGLLWALARARHGSRPDLLRSARNRG